MDVKGWAAGAVVTMVIGGSAYSFNQSDVIGNFADDTGMSQEASEEYITNVNEADLVSWGELASGHVTNGQELIKQSNEIDCVNYEYEWQTPSLSCQEGKDQLYKTGSDEITLGNSYKVLDSDAGSKNDMTSTIGYIDQVNFDYQFEIMQVILGPTAIDENFKTNSYNKAVLNTALKSE